MLVPGEGRDLIQECHLKYAGMACSRQVDRLEVVSGKGVDQDEGFVFCDPPLKCLR